MQSAIGLIETKGLLALIEATDAMAKAASVEIVKRVDIGGAYVTTVVSGDVLSVSIRFSSRLIRTSFVPRCDSCRAPSRCRATRW